MRDIQTARSNWRQNPYPSWSEFVSDWAIWLRFSSTVAIKLDEQIKSIQLSSAVNIVTHAATSAASELQVKFRNPPLVFDWAYMDGLDLVREKKL